MPFTVTRNTMSHHTYKINRWTVPVIWSLVLLGVISVLLIGRDVSAAWNPPAAQPPAGNVFAPLNTSPDNQAKKGRLLLDPFYNPYGELPSFQYQLTVRGSRDTYINDFIVTPNGTLGVDNDTLYVSGDDHRIGVRTASPDTLLEVAGGVVIGDDATGVSGSALVSGSELSYGVLGETQADTVASVLGRGIGAGSIGVYGLHTSGIGIRAQSISGSAVVGSTAAALDRNSGVSKVAGIYAQAEGLGAWAGYFTKQVIGSDEVLARAFVPNRLQQSQYPYTIGWEMREIIGSERIEPQHILYDGTWLWTHISASWDSEPYFYLLDPETGSISEEFRLVDSGGNAAHSISEMILANGYVWIANHWDDNRGVSRVDLNDPTHTATHFMIGSHAGGAYDGAAALVYDNYSSGGPYIWTVNDSGNDWDYSISRLRPADGSYLNFKLNPTSGQSCLSYDQSLCEDGLDNDGDGLTDAGVCSDPTYHTQSSCQDNGGTWNAALGDPECINNQAVNPMTSGSCSNAGLTNYTDCTNAGATWTAADERVAPRTPNGPTGITIQPNAAAPSNPTIWVSFGGLIDSRPYQYFGEAVARFDGNDPTNTTNQQVFCPGPSQQPQSITYGDDAIWIGKYPHWTKHQGGDGIARLDPVTGTFTHYAAGAGVTRIRYDDATDGGPFIWGMNYWQLFKLDTAGTIINQYELPDGGGDFTIDRTSGASPYIWGAHGTSSLVSRSTMTAPYETITYIPKGSYSEDLAFDGANVWSTNSAGNTVSKFRASDGTKIGDYYANWQPEHITYDGSSMWVTHQERSGVELAQLNARDGTLIGDYDYQTGGLASGADMIYDGRYLWISDDNHNIVRRVDTRTCSSGVCTAVAQYSVPDNPYYLAYDGTNIWVTRRGLVNTFSRLDRDTGAILDTYTIADAYNATNNLNSILSDGTYLWIGTDNRDADGHSLYKFRLADGELVDTISLYNEPGVCSGGDRDRLECTTNTQCTGGGSCSERGSHVSALTYDGTHIWAVQEREAGTRECDDGIDNDGDGLTDAGSDPDCADDWDTHEQQSSAVFGTSTDAECSDGIDNDGNGRCDWDGAAGSPGCSGTPDPWCSGPNDISEQARPSAGHLSRINAGTSQFIESIYYAGYCNPNSLAFDGASIWINQTTNNCDSYILHQYYAGTGQGTTDYEGVLGLQSTIPGRTQSGSVATYGDASVGRQLIIGDDLIVHQNVWGGNADSVVSYEESCPDGEFAKGVDSATGMVYCRPL